MVIASILIAMVFAGVILNLVLSQSRLSIHSSSRVQAYYASLAGSNYAFEMLRTTVWPPTGPYTHVMCQSLTNPDCCVNGTCTSCDIAEPNLPNTISCVNILIDGTTGPANTLQIKTTAVYTAPA